MRLSVAHRFSRDEVVLESCGRLAWHRFDAWREMGWSEVGCRRGA
jgi:hypothetical protein